MFINLKLKTIYIFEDQKQILKDFKGSKDTSVNKLLTNTAESFFEISVSRKQKLP